MGITILWHCYGCLFRAQIGKCTMSTVIGTGLDIKSLKVLELLFLY